MNAYIFGSYLNGISSSVGRLNDHFDAVFGQFGHVGRRERRSPLPDRLVFPPDGYYFSGLKKHFAKTNKKHLWRFLICAMVASLTCFLRTARARPLQCPKLLNMIATKIYKYDYYRFQNKHYAENATFALVDGPLWKIWKYILRLHHRQ